MVDQKKTYFRPQVELLEDRCTPSGSGWGNVQEAMGWGIPYAYVNLHPWQDKGALQWQIDTLTNSGANYPGEVASIGSRYLVAHDSQGALWVLREDVTNFSPQSTLVAQLMLNAPVQISPNNTNANNVNASCDTNGKLMVSWQDNNGQHTVQSVDMGNTFAVVNVPTTPNQLPPMQQGASPPVGSVLPITFIGNGTGANMDGGTWVISNPTLTWAPVYGNPAPNEASGPVIGGFWVEGTAQYDSVHKVIDEAFTTSQDGTNWSPWATDAMINVLANQSVVVQ